MVNGLDTLTRDAGDIANAYEYLFDINTGSHAAPVWMNVPELTGLAPVHTPVKQDATVYADQGTSSNRKTGSNFALAFTLLKKRDPQTGEFSASWLALDDAAAGDGEDNVIEVRYYDAKGASDAWQGPCSVSKDARPETGATGLGWEAFSFESTTRMSKIENPLTAAAVPIIDSALPSGRAANQIVTLLGHGFDGTTGVTVGGTAVAAGNWSVENGGRKLVIVLPAGSSGSAPIIVTNGAGPSAAKTYTRA